jgi:hypothetical protein
LIGVLFILFICFGRSGFGICSFGYFAGAIRDSVRARHDVEYADVCQVFAHVGTAWISGSEAAHSQFVYETAEFFPLFFCIGLATCKLLILIVIQVSRTMSRYLFWHCVSVPRRAMMFHFWRSPERTSRNSLFM